MLNKLIIALIVLCSTATAYAGKPSLYHFSATWCGPCRTMAPYWKDAQVVKHLEDYEVYHVDLDEYPQFARELGVRAVPAIVVRKNGQVTRREIGLRSVQQLREILSSSK